MIRMPRQPWSKSGGFHTKGKSNLYEEVQENIDNPYFISVKIQIHKVMRDVVYAVRC